MRFSKFITRAIGAISMAIGLVPSVCGASVLINEIMYHPSSENILEEYIELFNNGPTNVSLAGWRFSRGVQFAFPNVTIPANGFLVIAADVTTFTNKYPGVANVIGGWTGRLSNSRNDIDLDDAASNRVDSVEYADEGDWAVRMKGPPDHGHRGWTWYAQADGLGKSLELINPNLSNNYGQNWAPSVVTNGTPGVANSVSATNVPPLILSVQHLPPIPRSLDNVLVSARLLDERSSGLTATLHWRLDGNAGFTSQAMFDDGSHSDGVANDGVFATTIPPQANNAIVEFYVSAMDQDGLSRTWPAPAIDTNLVALGQAANMLYQVDDSTYTGAFPLYKLIMRDVERAELAVIGSAPQPGESDSDAEMNGTFISVDGTGTDVRYIVGFRNRGHGTRNDKPNNYRLVFNADRPWKGVTGLNINAQFAHAQLLGSVLSLKAGLGGADARPVQIRVNNVNLGVNSPTTPATSSRMLGTTYVANEAINSDWAEHWYPNDSSGNIYRANRDIPPPDFAWRGSNYLSYTNTWYKQSNTSENDWTDLMGMLRILGTNDLFTADTARNVIHVEQWFTYLAVMALFDNRETSIHRGYNDDYFLYSGITDRRFVLMYYDLDTVLGEGDATGSTTDSIFSSTNQAAFYRLMKEPQFEPIYFNTLQRLLNTTFSKTEFDLTVDQTLSDFVPAPVIARMKTWMDGRRAYVQSVIAPYVATNSFPPVATISGEPRSPTPFRSATLAIAGAGVTQYRYKLNNGAFSGSIPVATPISLSNLPQGSTNTVYVVASGANGIFQADSNATVSKTWVVNTNTPAVRINEVLARNVAGFNWFGTYPDAIELYNEGSTTVNLAGLRLTDRIASPNKYTFPTGATLAPGTNLVVIAGNSDGTPGIHTGFSLDQDGEGVFLFNSVANGGALLDSVEFGLQLPDLSIGRVGTSGEFVLTQPTFGAVNTVKTLGDQHKLKINEWLASEFAAATTDFVELYNPETSPAALGGLYFTDNSISEPTKHAIAPLTFIDAKGYRVFKADGDPSQGLDHLNFKLAAEQGLIALLAANLDLIDVVLYGPQTTDISQGRVPDGGSTLTFFTMPSAGSANPAVVPCTRTTTNMPLMALTNVWRYMQTANLDGVNWTATNYNDSAWPSGYGLLAFENNSALINLIKTTLLDPRVPPAGLTPGHAYYFRTALNLTNSLSTFTVNATVYADDGAIIYVNGNEVFPRIRMGGGVVTNRTPASAQPSGGDATTPTGIIIPSSMFKLGTNVIAVEVHQENTNSTDVVWGLALDATMEMINCVQSAVVLNEVFANNQSYTNAAGRAPDWVELYNATTNTINLSDMSLSDDTKVPRKWVFTNTFLPAGARLVIEFDDSLPPSTTNTSFALSANGEGVYLFKKPADGGTMLDSINFGLQAADFSIGRMPDGSGSWALTQPTRGTANVAAGLGNPSSLKINEWMANDPNGDDWLEVYNPNPQPVEVTGLALSDNPSVHNKSPLPPLSFLSANGYQKFVADGNVGAAADHVNFNLGTTSGFIGLYWPIGTQIDALSYGQQGTNVSQGRFPDGTANVVSFTNTASAGAPNYFLLDSLVINEVLSHTDPPLEDAVEIRNASSNAVDISGWYLSNTEQDLRKCLLPTNTIVPAGGYKVIYEYQFGTNASPAALVPFTFNSAHGDEVHLSQTIGTNLTGFRARAKFGAAANGVSFGRFVTSVREEFVAMSARSFGVTNPTTVAQFRTGTGAANPYPLVGPVVISEINYRPASSYNGDTNAAEFIELLNIASTNVPLYDPNATSNTWRLADGVDFVFPTNVSLPVGGSLLIVSFDPVADSVKSNWFRSTYAVPASVPMLGPYAGGLASEGEDLELLKPDPPQAPPSPDAGFVPYVLVEHVHYLATGPWPTNGIGSGASLQRSFARNFGNEPLNWFTGAPSPGRALNDSDGDGLPDYWELAYGLNPNDGSGNNGASGDFDGDRQSNGQEFLAGTSPTNSADNLRFRSVVRSGNTVRLQFNAGAGRTYSVLFSNNSPLGPWQKLADAPLSPGPTVVEIVDQNLSASPRFYRLVAPQIP